MVVSNSLTAGISSLSPGENLISSDQVYTVVYQYDGNVVLYKKDKETALWATNTYRPKHSLGLFKFNSDGNLVLYDGSSNIVWQSNTSGLNGQIVTIGVNGNFVMTDKNQCVVWQTNTKQTIEPRQTIYADQVIRLNEELTSPNGQNYVKFQKGGNLAVYKNGVPVWESDTYHKGGYVVNMQLDGNFVMYSKSASVFDSKTYGKGGCYATIQDDGNFIVATGDGTIVWQTDTGN